ncbi:SPW repeat protein [Aureimonas sp. AU4]|uniref:SPW repeat protein n=1 Tax=Aureimonas sp. AU4 TaxID=1638163 RepID=UPI000780715B|nr:SPW repeat protein [Aureimonas sp. AU4]
MNDQHWQDWLVAVIGAWLILSNWVFGFTAPATAVAGGSSLIFWNALLVGAIAVVLSVAALASFRIWEEWADIALGVWLVVSPWVLGFTTVRWALLNVVICGLAIILSAAWVIWEVRETGHPA